MGYEMTADAAGHEFSRVKVRVAIGPLVAVGLVGLQINGTIWKYPSPSLGMVRRIAATQVSPRY